MKERRMWNTVVLKNNGPVNAVKDLCYPAGNALATALIGVGKVTHNLTRPVNLIHHGSGSRTLIYIVWTLRTRAIRENKKLGWSREPEGLYDLGRGVRSIENY
jgi:hypothetical protein